MTLKVAMGIDMREANMMVYVQYQNNQYDFVNTETIDRLLTGKKIRRFRRPSEKRCLKPHFGMGPLL